MSIEIEFKIETSYPKIFRKRVFKCMVFNEPSLFGDMCLWHYEPEINFIEVFEAKEAKIDYELIDFKLVE